MTICLTPWTSAPYSLTSFCTDTLWPVKVSRRQCRAEWRGRRTLNSRLRELGFESCTALSKPGQVFHSILLQFTQLYEWVPGYRQWWLFVIAAWLNVSQRSWDGVRVNRSAREVKWKVLWAVLRTGYCAHLYLCNHIHVNITKGEPFY